jgi:hypothetical protein
MKLWVKTVLLVLALLNNFIILKMNPQEVTLNFTLSIDETNAILAALQELPAKICNPMTQKIKSQAEPQIKQLQEAAEAQQAEKGELAGLVQNN